MNFEEVIADLMIEDNPDLQSRLECQQEALRESVCVNPVLGQWIDNNDVPYLLDALSLMDDDFAERFPSMAHIPSRLRLKIADTLERHFELCNHCSLKKAYDLELEARFNRSCLKHRNQLQRLFQNDEPVTEDEHHGKFWFSNHVWAKGALLASVVPVLVVSVILIQSYRPRRDTSNLALYQEEMSRLEHTNSNMQVVHLTSRLMLRSSGDEISRISIHPTTSVVRFQLELPVDETKTTYNVMLATDLGEVLSLQDLKRVDNNVSISLPARFLAPSYYRLTVSRDPNGRTYNYYFKVIR